MPGNDKRAEPPLQKFRLPAGQQLSNLLRPDVLDDEVRQRIVRDVMGAVATTTRDDRPSSGTPASLKRHSREGNYPASLRDRVSGGGGDLLGAMAQRLKTLEAQQKAYRMELKEKTEKLACAEANYKEEKAKREEAEAMVVELYDEKQELERLVGDMQKFLADYGLKWVGDRAEERSKNRGANSRGYERVAFAKGGSSPSSEPATSQSFELYAGDYSNQTPVLSPSPTPRASGTDDAPTQKPLPVGRRTPSKTNTAASLPVSIEVLQRNAKILSDHVGCRGVVTNGRQGGIKEFEVVRIVVYEDGICVNGGPFRPFGWPLCDAVVNDLAEGFYPYEFKQRFPDGFPIEVIDQTSVRCSKGKDAKKDDANVKDLRDLQDGGGYQPVSREEFLKRLPATRITTNGRIVPVREAIANIIGRPSKAETVRHVSEAERRVTGGGSATEAESGDAAVSPHRIRGLVAVLVRFPSGVKVTLQLSPESTIADLRHELKSAVPSFTAAYDVRLSFPAVTYTDDAKTLRELGLLTSCTLMIQPRTHA
ncbi:uncharacterized protein Tco025E_00836 [Trypanosoma conorhini]|uniref:UBX domain-containing protein 11 n=1 Tax=Trypanosoma conorhini TaxID=83891 RepID=A0A3R7LL72_9TRYP|nr:uncharacterized protein Tco025E_00836 [Trypanosoma conorhini]RNF26874.1 hypothetical protein Tco025E_00836 [Trypanosoma conorhini]